MDTTLCTGAARSRPFIARPSQALAIISIALLAGGLTLALGLDPPDADIKYDWLAAGAAITGNAYDPVLGLADAEGVEILVNYSPGGDSAVSHPRTPGALLILTPLRLLPFSTLFAVSLAVSIALLMLIVMPALDQARLTAWQKWLNLGMVFVLVPTAFALRYAGQAVLVAALVYLACVLEKRQAWLLAGLAVAVAASLKLFPFLLVGAWLFSGRKRAAYSALLLTLGINVLGLLLPGVGLRDAIVTLSQTPGDFAGIGANISMTSVLSAAGVSGILGQIITVVIVLGFVGVLWIHKPSALRVPLVWLLIGLMALPLSWVSYDVLVFPTVLILFHAGSRELRLAGAGLLALWIASSASWLFGAFVLVPLALTVRLALLAIAVTVAPIRAKSADPDFDPLLWSDAGDSVGSVTLPQSATA